MKCLLLAVGPADTTPLKEVLCDSCEGMPPILMQGIIDLWYKDEEGITVVDYKTDRILKCYETFLKGTGGFLYKSVGKNHRRKSKQCLYLCRVDYEVNLL